MPTYYFDHVHLLSTDALAAGKFYAEMFNAETSEATAWKGLPRCDMKLGGHAVLITTASGEPRESAECPHQHLGLDHFGLLVDNTAEAVKELKAQDRILQKVRGARQRDHQETVEAIGETFKIKT